jgi:hypothetical protein
MRVRRAWDGPATAVVSPRHRPVSTRRLPVDQGSADAHEAVSLGQQRLIRRGSPASMDDPRLIPDARKPRKRSGTRRAILPVGPGDQGCDRKP